jgi:hypothetical protein
LLYECNKIFTVKSSIWRILFHDFGIPLHLNLLRPALYTMVLLFSIRFQTGKAPSSTTLLSPCTCISTNHASQILILSSFRISYRNQCTCISPGAMASKQHVTGLSPGINLVKVLLTNDVS